MPPQDPFIGRDILSGQFQILQKIGSGGMGAVYKALQPEMNRMVGVKILHPKLANRKDLVSRFRREARALSQLTHPNTVKVFLYGELDDGSLYIIMEFLEGKNLNQTVRSDGPFSAERALPILVQVCGALDEAHRAGIIHRDLKPENIFLVQSGTLHDFPKVLDFGLAKVGERQMRPGSVILTQEGMVFGTPEFMSPEQAQGKPLTSSSDIYSLAVILYEVLTGKLPYEAKSAMDYIQLHVTGKPIPLNQRVPGRVFPTQLEDLIARALAKRPEDRFESAAIFGEAMQGFMRATGQPVPAVVLHTPVAVPAVTVAPVVPAVPSPAGSPFAAPAQAVAMPLQPQIPVTVGSPVVSPAASSPPTSPVPVTERAVAPLHVASGSTPHVGGSPTEAMSPATANHAAATVPMKMRDLPIDPAGGPLPSLRAPGPAVGAPGVPAVAPMASAASAPLAPRTNLGLLVVVAVAFLCLGIGLALVLAKFVLR